MKSPHVRLSVPIFVIMASCQPSTPHGQSEEKRGPVRVISAYGHGAFFVDGKPVDLNPDLALATQASLINDLQRRLERSGEAMPEERLGSLEENSRRIDGLVGRLEGRAAVRALALSRAIDRALRAGQAPREGRTSQRAHFLQTNASGANYRQLCLSEGVPLPDVVAQPNNWTHWKYPLDPNNPSNLDGEFLPVNFAGGDAELWSKDFTSPRGTCVALPRYNNNDEAYAVGVICLGHDTGKACFFDNAEGISYQRGELIDFTELIGGTTLLTNGGGECSDCHAGANLLVIHPKNFQETDPNAPIPSETPFTGFRNNLYAAGGIPGWYDPIIPPSPVWPENPGPMRGLGPVPDDEFSCDGCHTAALGTNFPLVSDELQLYCSSVLSATVHNQSSGTMPRLRSKFDKYETHRQRLARLCSAPPASANGGEGQGQAPQDDPAVVSPVDIFRPLYACAQAVAVRGAKFNSLIRIFVNGQEVAQKVARSAGGFVTVELPSPLALGDKVEALQNWAGVDSPPAVATAKDHTADYPDGLPKPSVKPISVYECAQSVGAQHVPGSKVTVETTQSNPTLSYGIGATGLSWLALRAPLVSGEQVRLKQRLCSDESPWSETVAVGNAPTSLPAPSLDHPGPYENQEIVRFSSLTSGAWVEVEEASTGPIADMFSFPWNARNFDVVENSSLALPLGPGDSLIVRQRLCSQQPLSPPLVTPPALGCGNLPAPRIATPFDGESFITLEDPLPGALVRVIDSDGNEIGDGSGDVVMLIRPLQSGELIQIYQQLSADAECAGPTYYYAYVL